MLILTFCIFLAGTFIGIVLADAHNVRAQFDQMRANHEHEVEDLYSDCRDRAYELYMRSNPDINIRLSR